jgi:hypothetical protein
MANPPNQLIAPVKRYNGSSNNMRLKTSGMKYTHRLLSQDRVSQVFGYYFNDYHDKVDDIDDYDYQHKMEYPSLPDEYQLSLELESLSDMYKSHKMMIEKYDSAIHRMAASALLWHDLMEDIENSTMLKAKFEELQTLRALKFSR